MAEHRPQPAAGLGRKAVDQLQIAAQQLGVAQPAGGGGQRREQKRNHLAGGHRTQLHRRADAIADHVFTAFARDGGHILEEGEHQVIAPAKAAQALGAFHVVGKPGGAHHPRGVVKGSFERVEQLGRGLVEAGAVLVEVEGHRAILGPAARIRPMSGPGAGVSEVACRSGAIIASP